MTTIAAVARPSQRAERIAALDALRAIALFGVFTVNVGFVAHSSGGPADVGVDQLTTYLLHDKSRTLLSILFGAGAALMFLRGTPISTLMRRYGVLFVVFGAVNLYYFPADILTHYALVGILLMPAVGWLTRGTPARPLALAAVFAIAEMAVRTIASGRFGFGTDILATSSNSIVLHLVLAANQLVVGMVLQGPWTAAAFCIGVWLTRRITQPRLGRMLAAVGGAAAVTAHLDTALLPSPPDESVAGLDPAHSLPWMAAGFGGAVCYVGLVLLLIDRSRLLRRLAPFGRLTLTAYLTSTALAVYLNDHAPGLGLTAGFASMTLLWIAFALGAPMWERHFAYGPAEWLWRRATYGRPLPIRRSASG